MTAQTTPEQLRFHSIPGMTIRADFNGGALSTDFGALLLDGTNRQTGLIARIADAIHDKRHQSYVSHAIEAILAQRSYQIALGYFDGNDSNALRTDPMLKLGLGQRPLDEGNDTSTSSAQAWPAQRRYHALRIPSPNGTFIAWPKPLSNTSSPVITSRRS